MITLSARVSGSRTPVLHKAIEAAAFAAVEKACADLAAEITRRVESPPKTGVVYTHGPEPVPHQASAPGEAPANWTGALVASVSWSAQKTLSGAKGTVLVAAPYAQALELGTVDMAARPFVGPSADVIKPLFIADLTRRVKSLRSRR